MKAIVNYQQKQRFSCLGLHLIMILFSLFCVIPFILIIGISLTGETEIYESGYKFIPDVVSLDAYKYVLNSSGSLLKVYGQTIAVTILGTSISLLVTAMLAYTVSRKFFFLSKIISFFVFFAMLFSAGVVPWYIIISKILKLKNTFWALVLPYIVIPWYVMLLKGFFTSVPDEIIESANIDGAGDICAFFRIVLPISKPALTTIGLFIALNYWNDYRLCLYFITDENQITLQYMLQRIMSNINFLRSNITTANVSIRIDLPSESARMAMCVLAAGPMLVIFPFFQKYFIKGITLGALKG